MYLHSVDCEQRLDVVVLDRFVEFAGTIKLPPHTNEVLELDVIGDMAWAKVRLGLPDREFFDILTLLKLGAGWKIVSKTNTTVMKKDCGEGLFVCRRPAFPNWLPPKRISGRLAVLVLS